MEEKRKWEGDTAQNARAVRLKGEPDEEELLGWYSLPPEMVSTSSIMSF